MRFINKNIKYMYSFIAVAIATFLIFAIASPAYAVTGPGAQWEDLYDVTLYRSGATAVKFNMVQRNYVYTNCTYIYNSSSSVTYFRQARFIFYEMLTEFDQPVAVFAFKNVNLMGDGSSTPQFFISGNWKTVYDITAETEYHNDRVYMKTFTSTGYVRCTMLFVPIEQIIPYPWDSSADTTWELNYLPMWFRTQANNNQLYVLGADFTQQYIGNIDLENSNIIQYIDNIEFSLNSIDQKLDAVISILQNQQSQQQASSSINSAETVHNNIDQIQTSSGTALSNGFNSFLQNPDLSLNTSTISGASFLATLSTSIFNNIGIFNWNIIFPAFIGLGTYLIGRGSKVLK